MSRSHQSGSGRPRCSWRRGCERHPAAPQCPSSEPHLSSPSAPLGYRTDYNIHRFVLVRNPLTLMAQMEMELESNLPLNLNLTRAAKMNNESTFCQLLN